MKKRNNTFDIFNTRHVIKAVLLLRPVTSRNQNNRYGDNNVSVKNR